jgi:hypothetical protein
MWWAAIVVSFAGTFRGVGPQKRFVAQAARNTSTPTRGQRFNFEPESPRNRHGTVSSSAGRPDLGHAFRLSSRYPSSGLASETSAIVLGEPASQEEALRFRARPASAVI